MAINEIFFKCLNFDFSWRQIRVIFNILRFFPLKLCRKQEKNLTSIFGENKKQKLPNLQAQNISPVTFLDISIDYH